MNEKDLKRIIDEAVAKAVEEAIEKEAALAAEKVTKALRERVGAIAVGLLAYYSVERMGPNLVIRVENATENE